ncbi:hypothetical protein OUZ56_017775 [Daphnia magna]|uniref:Uncharacterized protein n=1 Tax=Daphnia magna TaxID=35525 RepID=A0ABR0ATW6_9CRUS|nr:hypothetical protein OUZ56_017775 [Daphnia magna]
MTYEAGQEQLNREIRVKIGQAETGRISYRKERRYEFLKINSERGCAWDLNFWKKAGRGQSSFLCFQNPLSRTVDPITVGPAPSEPAQRAASDDTGLVMIRDRKNIWIEKIPWGLDAMG